MKSLLDALQEGRLVELSDTDKDKALEFLALLIEAIPDIGGRMDIVKDVKEREAQANTAIGYGVAIPHVRTGREGELLCAVGWSPAGIDYGAPDGRKVHLLIMYYVPDSRRPLYFKEVSGLAKAMKKTGDIGAFTGIEDIQAVRHKLLDWVALAIDEAVPDAKARMIKLEARQAAAPATAEGEKARISPAVVPFRILADETRRFVVLSQDAALIAALEKPGEIERLLAAPDGADVGGYKTALFATSAFALGRTLYDGVAIRTPA
jgi:mannitol/fructose-specific phosphotransferase system IIA component (Ntr-type)